MFLIRRRYKGSRSRSYWSRFRSGDASFLGVQSDVGVPKSTSIRPVAVLASP